jgi:hypothetical protein
MSTLDFAETDETTATHGGIKSAGQLFLSAADIEDLHRGGRELKLSEIERFASQGIAMAHLMTPTPVRADRIVFRKDGSFDFERDGVEGTVIPAFTIAVEGGIGRIIDIAAWEPRSGRVALLLNRAFALGEEQIWQPNLNRDPLPIWRSPFGWLRAGRRGLVLLRPAAAPFYFRDIPTAAAEDLAHGEWLERILKPPKPTTHIVIRTNQQKDHEHQSPIPLA